MIAKFREKETVQASALGRETSQCLNCGESIVGRYCHRCGQLAGRPSRSIWQFVQEFLDEFLRFDSKFLRTLAPLVIRPGFLTAEWVAGRRAKYITPFKLYVTLSALCFLAISMVPNTSVVHVDNSDSKSLSYAQKALAEKQKKTTSGLEKVIDQQTGKLLFEGPVGAANRKQFSDELMGHLPTANLILLPIFAFLFKALYIRRSRFYVEHLVFALHYYAFFSLGLAILTVSTKFAWIGIPVFLWMVAYLPIAMVVNYRQRIFKTLVKCAIFCAAYLAIVSAVLVGMVLYTAYRLPAVDQATPSVSSVAPKDAVTGSPAAASLPAGGASTKPLSRQGFRSDIP